MTDRKLRKFIIIGDPISHSLSPVMYGAAFKELGLEGQYSFEAVQVKAGEVGKMVACVRVEEIGGMTCTAPCKEEVMQYLDEIDPVAREIGAVNTVVNDSGRLIGHNTDWLGIVAPLEKVTDLAGKKVALLGAGGAARAMVYGLTEKGAEVKIFNRSIEKAQELADEFECQAGGLEEISEVRDFDIIINSTTVGMGEQAGQSLVPVESLRAGHIVMDAVYHPPRTKLIREAESKGATVIPGAEMLLYQGLEQFKLYIGREAPKEVMRAAVEENLNAKN